MYDAGFDESKVVGESILEVIEKSDKNVAFLASGSLSHRIPPNKVVLDYLNQISNPFNQTVDLQVLDLWQQGRHQEFITMFDKYAKDCDGEGGWDNYKQNCEVVTEYFSSSGTGQCNVIFPVE